MLHYPGRSHAHAEGPGRLTIPTHARRTAIPTIHTETAISHPNPGFDQRDREMYSRHRYMYGDRLAFRPPTYALLNKDAGKCSGALRATRASCAAHRKQLTSPDDAPLAVEMIESLLRHDRK